MKTSYLLISMLLLMVGCASQRLLKHTPTSGLKDDGIEITAMVSATADSVVVRPVRDDSQNPYYTYPMELDDDGTYRVFVPKWRRGMPYDRTHNHKPMMPKGEKFADTFDYKIVVYSAGVGNVFPPSGHYSAPMH